MQRFRGRRAHLSSLRRLDGGAGRETWRQQRRQRAAGGGGGVRLRAGARAISKKKQRIVAFLRSSLKSGSIILSEAQASPPYSSRLSICFKLKEHCTVFTCASQRRPMTPPKTHQQPTCFGRFPAVFPVAAVFCSISSQCELASAQRQRLIPCAERRCYACHVSVQPSTNHWLLSSR